MNSIVPQVLVSLVALGMGLAFLSADRDSPTSRALATALAFVGISIFLNVEFLRHSENGPVLAGWLAIPESVAIISVLEWLLRVRRTVPTRPGHAWRRLDAASRPGCGHPVQRVRDRGTRPARA